MPHAKSVYLDTNAIIRSVESEDRGLIDLFGRAAAGIFQLVTSGLALAEVLVMAFREDGKPLIHIYEDFLAGDDVLQARPVDREIPRRSAGIRATPGSKGPDAVHSSTAIAADRSLVISSDRRPRPPTGLTQIEIDHAGDLGAEP